MKRIKVSIPIILLICSLLIEGCSSTEINAKEETSIKEDGTYKITWSEKKYDHELEFTPSAHVVYGASSSGNKAIFYFDGNGEFEDIIVQSGICAIKRKDNSVMIISGDFVKELVKGE